MTVTYHRLRPSDTVNELWAATRRREGTTTVETAVVDDGVRHAAFTGGLLPVATNPAASPLAAAWVVSPSEALALSKRGIPGWRITVVDDGNIEAVLDAIARTNAAFVRTGRSRVATISEIVSLPSLATSISVFVDGIEEAVDAVAAGATDLILRGWNGDTIGELRDSLDHLLVERTALPPGVPVDEARDQFDADLFKAYLDQVDSSGVARPRYEWAPGKDMPAPVPPMRFSAEWPDAAWTDQASPVGFDQISDDLAGILQRSLDGTAPEVDELVLLFSARGAEVDVIAGVADELRVRANGDVVTYVVNRNINYTNQCYFKCGFCAFSKGPRSLNLRGDPYLMDVAEIVERAREAWDLGATEVCLQGGIHPEFTGQFYLDVLDGIKAELPDMHVHGFTPLEVWQGAETLGVSVKDFLVRLKDAGLGTLPGTAAEILDDAVRVHLCPDKIRTSQWAHVMVTAHELGLRSTSTIMFGHIDSPLSWAHHYEALRVVQRRTGGITEFVPLPFVHMGAPIYLQGKSRPGPTWDEVVLIHAVARIAFDGLIPNIQASWVKLGLEAGTRLLGAGCNDLGGTLMNEIISRSAGASHGQMVDASDLEEAIRKAGRIAVRRSTLYEVLETAD